MSTKPDESGYWPGLSRADYDALAGLNKSRLYVLIEKTPAHYRWLVDHYGDSETPAMRLGRLFHQAVLEPERFARETVQEPPPPSGDKWNRTKKEHKAAWAEFLSRHPIQAALAILSGEDWAKIVAMRESVYANSTARKLIEAAQKEVSFQWTDIETGVLCKGRADGVVARGAEGLVFDLKTTFDAGPRAFGYRAYTTGAVFQLAFYFDGIKDRAGFDAMRDPVFIAVETAQPYPCVCRAIDPDQLELGRWQYRLALERAARCTEAGVWPGYGEGLQSLVLPPWAGTELDPLEGAEIETEGEPDQAGDLGL